MQICFKCKRIMKDTKKPETLSFIESDINGESSKGFQRFDVYECPYCLNKSYGSSGVKYFFEDIVKYNTAYRDWGDVPHDEQVIINV